MGGPNADLQPRLGDVAGTLECPQDVSQLSAQGWRKWCSLKLPFRLREVVVVMEDLYALVIFGKLALVVCDGCVFAM